MGKHGDPPNPRGGPVEILPFLYLGSAYHAARRDMLDALGITALLNVSSDCPNHFEGHYQYKCIPVEDNHKADISSWFMEAIEYIGECLLRGWECCGRVLVHCQAGISRSATICLAYLMMKKRVKLEEAFEFVKQRRSIISPNFSFMGQLLQFESQVLATSYAVEAVSPSGTLRERALPLAGEMRQQLADTAESPAEPIPVVESNHCGWEVVWRETHSLKCLFSCLCGLLVSTKFRSTLLWL
uniref:Dual specificity phosphatase 4 n=1 Tax=Zosterops lateralis melanops TaxID=1220523 RepID=A0A8D2NK95_ZOSLA